MRIASALLLVIAIPVLGQAQSTVDSLNLAGRTNIMFGIGLTGARSATASPGFESTHTTGEVGSFAFNHWVSPEIGVLVSAAVLNADATSSGGIASTNAITPILFGASYSPRALALTTSLRPFVSAAVGPYIHTVSDAGPSTANSTSESVAGARFAAGANWFVARISCCRSRGTTTPLAGSVDKTRRRPRRADSGCCSDSGSAGAASTDSSRSDPFAAAGDGVLASHVGAAARSSRHEVRPRESDRDEHQGKPDIEPSGA
jgi:hypothetical protein